MKNTLKLFTVQSTAEIFQSLDIKFSFVNKEAEGVYRQVSNPIKCRDFLGDCIWSYKTKNAASIYGFKFNYKDTPYDQDVARFSLKFPNAKSKKFLETRIGELNTIEEKYGLQKSIILDTDEKSTLIIEGDKNWITASWKCGLYTFLLKRFSYEHDEALQDPENKYIKVLTPAKFDVMMNHVAKDVDHIWDGISYAHNYGGFVSLCTNLNPNLAKKLGMPV